LNAKIENLGNVASVSAGYPFRGKIQEFDDGTVAVIQMKDIDETQQVNLLSLMTTMLTGKKKPRWLEISDILFLARGNNNYAVYLDRVNEQTVCSPHFLQIHVEDEKIILPAFLAWQINQKPVQQYLSRVGEGKKVGNIRRSVLESIPIVIPTLKQQSLIIEMSEMVSQENEVLLQLLKNNQLKMTSIAQQLNES